MDGKAASLLLGLLTATAGATSGDAPAVQARPARVEAAFLRNFAHYVNWPAQAFASQTAPWRICILGPDPFGAVLDDTLQGRQEQGRAFQIIRGPTAAALASCQMAYLAPASPEARRAALAELAGRPVLTISDMPDFLQEGGMIRFHVADHVEFSVNLDQTRAAALQIPTKMIEVAHEVVENGQVRRRR